MNGLNSPALHVGVDFILLLAENSNVLKELSSDWPSRPGACGRILSMVEVGYFVTMFIVDISPELQWVVRCGEPLTSSRVRLVQLTDRVFSPLKLAESFQKHQEEFTLFFLLDDAGFCLFKGNRLRKWLSVAFLSSFFLSFCWLHTCVSGWHLHIYVAFRKTFAGTAGKGNIKDKDQTKKKGKIELYVVYFPGGIFSWYRPERRRIGVYYCDSLRAREKEKGTETV